MFKAILASLALVLSTSAFAKSVKVDPKRVVKIYGPIFQSGIQVAAEIERLADRSGKPIHVVINSPGGSIVSGSQILSAMSVAQNRGHELHCYVPMLAASMGFQILLHCNKRYALKYSLLLFHPMKVSSDAPLDSEQLLYASRRLRAWEKPFIMDLIKYLKISPQTFMYHYRNETLWMSFEFKALSSGFLEIVDDIEGVNGLFNIFEAE